MPTIMHQERLIPTSTVRHRRIGDLTETLPIIVARASRFPKKPLPPPIGNLRPLATMPNHHQVRQWMMPVGVTVVSMLVLIGVFQLLWAWGTITYQTLRYGYPRITQIDAVVGHQDSTSHPTHLIALNLHGQAQILELPGGDASQARMIVGPQVTGEGADLIPITLQFIKKSGDRIPSEMIIHLGQVEVRYTNTKGQFVPE